jgi:hypothetical protein
MSIRISQSIFARNVARLIEWAYDNGFELTLGEAWRPQWVADEYAKQGKGISKSLHIERLAIDLNLFRAGEFLTSEDDYRRLGDAWKSLHKMNRAGVDFHDAPHFSMSLGDGRA